MGTRALDERRWLLPDGERDEQLAMKRRLLSERHDVVAASVPGAEAAAAETAALVAEVVGAELDPERPPLEAAAVLVQEDLCLLVRRDGHWRLDAGVVCFPSMWRIADKVGLPLAAVHEPVPAYAEELAERVDRFLDRLRPDRPVWRRNWLVHDDPELHQPSPPEHRSAPSVPDGLWLRSERQTLRRLPASGAIVFTIRTQQVPFAAVGDRPELARRLAAAVRGWTPDLAAYRGASGWRDAALVWLDGR